MWPKRRMVEVIWHLVVLDCLPLARHELCKGARENIMEAEQCRVNLFKVLLSNLSAAAFALHQHVKI